MRQPLRILREAVAVYGSLLLFAAICLTWVIPALPLTVLLPARFGAAVARAIMSTAFRGYALVLEVVGAYRLDIKSIDSVAAGPPVVLAPNHLSIIDAILILTRHPRLVCVMKSQLTKNLMLGAGARFARYIGNEPPRRMIAEAVKAIEGGATVLLFPEGTRATRFPINELKGSVGLIAKHATVPVQTLIIESDSAFLSKGWPILRVPRLPVNYRIRVGRRFDPPVDVHVFTAELDRYFRAELADAWQKRWLPAA